MFRIAILPMTIIAIMVTTGCMKFYQIKPGNYLINSPVIGSASDAGEQIGRQARNIEKIPLPSRPNGGVPVNILTQDDGYIDEVIEETNLGGYTLTGLSNTNITVSLDFDLVQKGLEYFTNARVNINTANITKADYKITKVKRNIRQKNPSKFRKYCDSKDIARAYVTRIYLVDAEVNYYLNETLDTSMKTNLGAHSSPGITVKQLGNDNKVTLQFENSWGVVTVEDRRCD